MQSNANLKTEWKKRNRGLVMSRSRNHKDIANETNDILARKRGRYRRIRDLACYI